jgi:hypothetical protein
MVIHSPQSKRFIFSLTTFWVVFAFTWLGDWVASNPYAGPGSVTFLWLIQLQALAALFGLAKPSNQSVLGMMTIAACTWWLFTHGFDAAAVSGAHFAFAVAASTGFVANLFADFEPTSRWQAPKWTAPALIVVAVATVALVESVDAEQPETHFYHHPSPPDSTITF